MDEASGCRTIVQKKTVVTKLRTTSSPRRWLAEVPFETVHSQLVRIVAAKSFATAGRGLRFGLRRARAPRLKQRTHPGSARLSQHQPLQQETCIHRFRRRSREFKSLPMMTKVECNPEFSGVPVRTRGGSHATLTCTRIPKKSRNVCIFFFVQHLTTDGVFLIRTRPEEKGKRAYL